MQCLEFECRGKQHCQKDTSALLARSLLDVQDITDRPLLPGRDGGENIDLALEHNAAYAGWAPVDFLIKWNPRIEG